MKNHEKFMKMFRSAILGLKKTLTNPLVGCVIVKNIKLLHLDIMKHMCPHAEVNELKPKKSKKL